MSDDFFKKSDDLLKIIIHIVWWSRQLFMNSVNSIGKPTVGDKTILCPFYLHNGIFYAGNITSLYWIRAPDTDNSSTSNGHQGEMSY